MGITNSYINGLQYEAPHPFRTQADRMNNLFLIDAFVEENGVVRWKSNNSIPPSDILEFWSHLGKPFNYELSLATQKKETAEFLAKYRESMKNYEPSEEELFEMRAAFGPEETVVNVFTGKKIQL